MSGNPDLYPIVSKYGSARGKNERREKERGEKERGEGEEGREVLMPEIGWSLNFSETPSFTVMIGNSPLTAKCKTPLQLEDRFYHIAGSASIHKASKSEWGNKTIKYIKSYSLYLLLFL
jgi:hypothetical protein